MQSRYGAALTGRQKSGAPGASHKHVLHLQQHQPQYFGERNATVPQIALESFLNRGNSNEHNNTDFSSRGDTDLSNNE